MKFSPDRSHAAGSTLVEQVVDVLKRAIEVGELAPGEAVLSVRRFARAHRLSTFTVAEAYGRLVAQGLLVARQGAGHRVAPRRRAGSAVQRSWEPPQLGAAWLLSDIFADQSIPTKAGCGWLPPEWGQESGLRHALRHASRLPSVRGYGQPQGYLPLRERIAADLARHGLSVEADQVLLTQGVTHGLDVVVRTLLKPGDTVVVEVPGYTNLLQMLRLAGLRVVGVARTCDGLDVEAFEDLARTVGPRALFVNTVLHNPTGTTLSMANAFQLLQVAGRYGIWVIEDDISRDLHTGVAPMLAAMDGANRVVYAGGFSKTLSPSVRVGYLVAQRALVGDLARTKMAVGLTSPEIMERVVLHVVCNGHHAAHVTRLRAGMEQAHVRVAARMQERGFEIFAEPSAGLYLWARPGGVWRDRGANQLARCALLKGIWLAPGAYFSLDERDLPWLRFNVFYSDEEPLWQFLDEVGASDRVALPRAISAQPTTQETGRPAMTRAPMVSRAC